MADDGRALISELERGVTDDSRSISSLLNLCIVLGGHANSSKLRDWARQELRGYELDEELPSYRTVAGRMCIDAQVGPRLIRGQAISRWELPKQAQEAGIDDSVRLDMPIGELEEYLHRDEKFARFTMQNSPMIVRLMNSENQHSFQQVHELYWEVSIPAVRGVVGNVRTSLAELVGELRANLPAGENTPTREAADQAVELIVTGKRHNITVTQALVSDRSTSEVSVREPDDADASWWTRLRKRGVVIGLSTMIAAIVATFTWFGWTPWG